jgi:hypothetical protein
MRFRLAFLASGLAMALFVAGRMTILAANSLGLWTSLPALPSAHQDHTATLLGDGKVLVAGGFIGALEGTGLTYSGAAALYRPAFNDWISVSPMGTARGVHGAALAGNGMVVVAGGEPTGAGLFFFTTPHCGDGLYRDQTSSVEAFDPATLGWTARASMSQKRADFSLVRLTDGTLLAAGGADSTAAEIYDGATDTWSSAGNMHSWRAGAAYTRLPDGRVLVAGGNYGAIWPFCDSTAEVYDPSTNTWTSTGDMALDRRYATAIVVRVADGSRRVLVAGGSDNRFGTVVSSAELYDPATNTWTPTGSMTTPRSGHTATLLTASGRVLVTGGSDGSSALSSTEVYDPKTGLWTALNSMAGARSRHTATQLLIPFTTKVAIVGGADGSGGPGGLTSAELFQPTPIASHTALSASGACQPITLTAFVASDTGTGLPTGTVAFKEGIFTLGSASVDAFGQASLLLGALPDGPHTFDAIYSGDDAFGSSSGTSSQPASSIPAVSIPGTFLSRALGASVLLPTSVSGGTAPYTYAWSRDGSPLSGGSTLTDVPLLGVNTYAVTVTDAFGCASAGALKQIDVFDFSLGVSPSDLTLYRSGLARSINASLTLVPGSSTSGLPATANVGSINAPPDLTGLGGTLAMPQTPGATLTGSLSLQPGSTSVGDYAVTVRASSRGGARVAPLDLHLLEDVTPPLIGLTVNGTAGANGWYVSDVTVNWTVSDSETPVTSTSGCGGATVSADTAGTTLTCTATSDGGTASRSVTIQRDVTPPVLGLPGPTTVNASQPAGAVVTYTATAADNVDPSPSLICAPASGTLLPIGQTTVLCQAANAAGLSSSGSFTVTVLSPSQQIVNLTTIVNNLPSPPGNSLAAKLQQILNDINGGNTAGACAKLASFINEVNAQRGKQISATDADALLGAAQTVRGALGC